MASAVMLNPCEPLGVGSVYRGVLGSEEYFFNRYLTRATGPSLFGNGKRRSVAPSFDRPGGTSELIVLMTEYLL